MLLAKVVLVAIVLTWVPLAMAAEPYAKAFEEWVLTCPDGTATPKFCGVITSGDGEKGAWIKVHVTFVEPDASLVMSFVVPPEAKLRKDITVSYAGRASPFRLICSPKACIAFWVMEKAQLADLVLTNEFAVEYKPWPTAGIRFAIPTAGLREALLELATIMKSNR